MVRTDQYRPRTEDVIDLASNDYLALSRHPRVIAAVAEALHRWGVGATGSRVVNGTLPPHHAVEAALADYCGFPSSVVLSSGYLANLAAVTTFTTPSTLLICDEHIHASLIDAVRLTTARRVICDVINMEHLDNLLRHHNAPHAVVVCDVVNSTDGTVVNIPAIVDVVVRHQALLIADYAHGLGVMGPEGRGPFAADGLSPAQRKHVIVTCTLSKALGSQGGAILCQPEQRTDLISMGRSVVFDTALAPALAAGAATALAIIVEEPERITRLHQVTARCATELGLPQPSSAILPLSLGCPDAARQAQELCHQQGVWVGCFRPPSVPIELSGLRLGLHSELSPAQIGYAAQIIRDAVTTVERNNGAEVSPGK